MFFFFFFFFFFFNTQKAHKLPPGKQFLLKTVSRAILPTECVSDTKEKIKPVIVDSAEEGPFEDEEVHDEDYTPSIDQEEEEDETNEKPQQ